MHNNNKYLPLTGLLTLLQWTIHKTSWIFLNISEIFHEIFKGKKFHEILHHYVHRWITCNTLHTTITHRKRYRTVWRHHYRQMTSHFVAVQRDLFPVSQIKVLCQHRQQWLSKTVVRVCREQNQAETHRSFMFSIWIIIASRMNSSEHKLRVGEIRDFRSQQETPRLEIADGNDCRCS